jgi:hypothetical protein
MLWLMWRSDPVVPLAANPNDPPRSREPNGLPPWGT